MKSLRITALGLALAAGFLASGSAYSATICSGCAIISSAPATYLGSHDPTATSPEGDESTFTHTGILGGTSFSDWWIFQINPAGNASVNGTFLLPTSVSNFKVDLFATTSPVCASPTTFGFGGACTALGTLGPLLATNTAVQANPTTTFFLPPVTLSSGFYAFHVTGDAGSNGRYSGNLATSVIPEPGSLALVALGLLGAGVSLRRNKKA